MKICIQFDENTERGQEMKRDWESAKAILEQDFEYIYGAPTSLTDIEVFDGLLFCFDGGANDGAGHGLPNLLMMRM